MNVLRRLGVHVFLKVFIFRLELEALLEANKGSLALGWSVVPGAAFELFIFIGKSVCVALRACCGWYVGALCKGAGCGDWRAREGVWEAGRLESAPRKAHAGVHPLPLVPLPTSYRGDRQQGDLEELAPVR